MLSDTEINLALLSGGIKISGHDELYIGPSSVDLHLAGHAKIMKHSLMPIKIGEHDETLYEDVKFDSILIEPGMFYLLSTIEKIQLSDSIAGFVEGRSSIGRLGIHVQSAGFVDIGFGGTITLEVSNLSPNSFWIPIGMRICQLVFFRSEMIATVPYGKKKDSKYMNQSGPTITKLKVEG